MASGGQIAWTKNAWGTAFKSRSTAAPLKEGDEECTMCRDKAVTIHFKPCAHGSCIECVESLRAFTIFKADKGLKCPYCRQFIEGYESKGGDQSTQRALQEANQAARAAANAREPAPKQQPLKPSRASSADRGTNGINDWTCMRCGNVNVHTRAKCSRAGCTQEAPPFIQDAIIAAKNPVDLMRMPKETIVKWAYIKLHPNFDSAFKDAGMPFTGKITGNTSSVSDAVMRGGHVKFLHVVDILVDEIPKLALDFYGNYLVQDLLEATKKLRDSVRQLQKKGHLTEEKAAAAVGSKDGIDALGQIVAKVAPISEEAALHNSGHFVLQKVMIVADSAELLPVARSLIKNCMTIAISKQGIHVMIKIVDKMRWLAFEATEAAKEAANLLNDLLGALVADGCERSFMSLAHSLHGGQLLVEAIQGALPLFNAQKAAQLLATEALDLTGSRSGVNTLKALLGLTALDHRSKDLIGANCCIIAQSLENHFAAVAINPFHGYTLVRRLLEILTEDNDETSGEWVCSIVSSLVLQVTILQESEHAFELIPFGLGLPVIPEEAVTMHIQMLGALLGQGAANYIAVQVHKKRHPGAPGVNSHPYFIARVIPSDVGSAAQLESHPATPPLDASSSSAAHPTPQPRHIQAPPLQFGSTLPLHEEGPVLPDLMGDSLSVNHSSSAKSHGSMDKKPEIESVQPSSGVQAAAQPPDVLSDLLNLAPISAALPQAGPATLHAAKPNGSMAPPLSAHAPSGPPAGAYVIPNMSSAGSRPTMPQPMPFRPPSASNLAPRQIAPSGAPPAANVGPPPPASLMDNLQPSSAQSSATTHFMAKLQESVSKQAAGQKVGKKVQRKVINAPEAAKPPAPAPTAVNSNLGEAWSCSVCTYMHAGKEADYLVCAICSLPRAF